jgi:hypothetical protein
LNLPRILAIAAAAHVAAALVLSAPFMGVHLPGYSILWMGLATLITVPRSLFDFAIAMGTLASLQALVAVGLYAGGRLRSASFWLSVGGLFCAIWIAAYPEATMPSTMTQLWVVGLAWAAAGQGLAMYSGARLRRC